MKNSLFALLLFASFSAFSQTTTPFRIPCAGVSPADNANMDWYPSIRTTVEADEINDEASEQIKDSLNHLYGNNQRTTSSAAQHSSIVITAPTVGTSVAGNGFGNSTPCDNEVAIANNGHLLSVQNSNIFRYRTVQGTSAGTQSLAFWASPLANTATKYDPKVLYDPEANRFIMVCLAGYASNSTNIIIGFSKTDTVNGAYNLYKIPGNPFNDTLWTDYPMIAVNQNELFVSVNLLHDNQSWQTGFVQTIIWQLNKWDGYNGDTLRTELHSNINYGGRPVRNLCPVEGGANTYPGPEMYFLSDRNLDASNDTTFLVKIADTANAVTQSVTVTALTTATSYFMPANARENGGDGGLMATNDSRVLGAFIFNDKIQFVHNTMDTASGRCAVYHGIISNATTSPSLQAYIISDTALEYGYPNIAYMGYGGSSDNNAIIFFLHTDSVTSPGNSVVATDGAGNYSPRTQVKAGQGYIDVLNGDERWGDYSGIQRKYDVGGTCWVNGMYGTSSHAHATWVAEIGVSSDVSVPAAAENTNDVSLYPNPFASMFQISFENPKLQVLKFSIYDVQGKLVQVLVEDQFREGRMELSFSTIPLAKGMYFLQAEGAEGNVLLRAKIVKE